MNRTPEGEIMESFRHLRAPSGFLGRGTQGICGAGYPWPSSIALTDNVEEVTCPQCQDKMEKEQ